MLSDKYFSGRIKLDFFISLSIVPTPPTEAKTDGECGVIERRDSVVRSSATGTWLTLANKMEVLLKDALFYYFFFEKYRMIIFQLYCY